MDNFVHVADTAGGPIFLEVRTTNVPAIALYESLGFEHQGVRKNYYQPSGADAFVMVRPAGCGVELSEGEDA
ncbi:ribosomal-protein-alanine N-acetyltransferase [Corynebacterium diphtheriae]|nr:ribosomal-protein-alanine N-acetyltransferase [Corynebacterium diphtheriae]